MLAIFYIVITPLSGRTTPGCAVPGEATTTSAAGLLTPIKSEETRDEPAEVAGRLMTEVRRPFGLTCVPGRELTVTASIGIAVGVRRSADEMLRDADLALYRVKASDKDPYVVYSSEVGFGSSQPQSDRHPVG